MIEGWEMKAKANRSVATPPQIWPSWALGGSAVNFFTHLHVWRSSRCAGIASTAKRWENFSIQSIFFKGGWRPFRGWAFAKEGVDRNSVWHDTRIAKLKFAGEESIGDWWKEMIPSSFHQTACPAVTVHAGAWMRNPTPPLGANETLQWTDVEILCTADWLRGLTMGVFLMVDGMRQWKCWFVPSCWSLAHTVSILGMKEYSSANLENLQLEQYQVTLHCHRSPRKWQSVPYLFQYW